MTTKRAHVWTHLHNLVKSRFSFPTVKISENARSKTWEWMIPREKPEANLSFSFCLVALESPAGILFLDGPLPRALRTLAEELVVPSELLKQEKQRRKGDKNRKETKLVCSQTSIFSFELKTAHRDLDFSVKRRDQGGEEAASKKKYLFLFSLFAVTGFHALRVEKKERERWSWALQRPVLRFLCDFAYKTRPSLPRTGF